MKNKICFFGPSGSGKTTCFYYAYSYIKQNCSNKKISHLNVSDDIKDISKYANLKMIGEDVAEDGKLIGLLAEHFSDRLGAVYINKINKCDSDVIINTDCRNNAYKYLKEDGFIFIKVNTDVDKRKERLALRNDYSEYDLSKEIEKTDLIVPDFVINNNGKICELIFEIENILNSIFGR